MSDTLHSLAQSLFKIGVARADPYGAVQSALADHPEAPQTCVAVGKAAGRMMQAALDIYGAVDQALVVTNYENAKEIDGVTVYVAGHPVPDENGAKAGQAVVTALHAATGPVLALISGGGSALLPAPKPPLTLSDKARVSDLLLASGADIVQMNLVRQQLSDLKGGGFLVHAAPHPVTALILSDVVGDDLRAIASGPTVGPLGDAAGARALCESLGIWDDLGAAVQKMLADDQPNPVLPPVTNTLIGSNGQSVAAMAASAPQAIVYPKALEGDVAQAAKDVVAFCQSPGVYLFGGETTVQIKGHGKGGRNQELALRVALMAQDQGWTDWCYLQGGTDGRDGPTDAAGGLVDDQTIAKARSRQVDIEAALDNNDSYHVLQTAEALLDIGATGTNVADLGVLIRR
ncbi:glycerate kinase type-2 family protein [Algirhabdus cladophorae]|uniref:glycerate kinase type-2 family protein n=1 Tax=Algirhabdus cladophorae TaxID=3377108 RepID=UPI003B849BE3